MRRIQNVYRFMLLYTVSPQAGTQIPRNRIRIRSVYVLVNDARQNASYHNENTMIMIDVRAIILKFYDRSYLEELHC